MHHPSPTAGIIGIAKSSVASSSAGAYQRSNDATAPQLGGMVGSAQERPMLPQVKNFFI